MTTPICPACGSARVGRDRKNEHRLACDDCGESGARARFTRHASRPETIGGGGRHVAAAPVDQDEQPGADPALAGDLP